MSFCFALVQFLGKCLFHGVNKKEYEISPAFYILENGMNGRIYRQKQPPEVFCKKVVLKNFANFTRKHLRWSPFLESRKS